MAKRVGPTRASRSRRRLRPVILALLAAVLFRLWDGRTLEVKEWLKHGDEYVVTLADGTTLILREREVKEVVPGEAPR